MSLVVRRAAVGIAAGLAGGAAMNVFSRIVAGDRHGRGVQPRQAKRSPNVDAAVKTGVGAYRAVTGHEPPRRLRPALGSASHYAFSASLGMTYAIASDTLPIIRTGFGTVFGALVWALADEIITPALGLSRSPRELPIGVHAYSLGGHEVFGATVEAITRWADSTTTS